MYGTYLFRDYRLTSTKTPFIIIDIPSVEENQNHERYYKTINAITKYIDKKLEIESKISILAISGPNILEMLIEETDWKKLIRIVQRKIQPDMYLDYQYRYKHRVLIRQEMDKVMEFGNITTDEAEKKFCLKKLQNQDKILNDTGISHFSNKLSWILDSIHPDEIILYSLCNGDLSHIKEIILQSRIRSIKFSLKTPMTNDPHIIRSLSSIMKREKIDGVE